MRRIVQLVLFLSLISSVISQRGKGIGGGSHRRRQRGKSGGKGRGSVAIPAPAPFPPMQSVTGNNELSVARRVVASLVRRDNAPAFIRLAFHDAFTGNRGVDASVRFELNAAGNPHRGTENALGSLQRAKQNLLRANSATIAVSQPLMNASLTLEKNIFKFFSAAGSDRPGGRTSSRGYRRTLNIRWPGPRRCEWWRWQPDGITATAA